MSNQVDGESFEKEVRKALKIAGDAPMKINYGSRQFIAFETGKKNELTAATVRAIVKAASRKPDKGHKVKGAALSR